MSTNSAKGIGSNSKKFSNCNDCSILSLSAVDFFSLKRNSLTLSSLSSFSIRLNLSAEDTWKVSINDLTSLCRLELFDPPAAIVEDNFYLN